MEFELENSIDKRTHIVLDKLHMSELLDVTEHIKIELDDIYDDTIKVIKQTESEIAEVAKNRESHSHKILDQLITVTGQLKNVRRKSELRNMTVPQILPYSDVKPIIKAIPKVIAVVHDIQTKSPAIVPDVISIVEDIPEILDSINNINHEIIKDCKIRCKTAKPIIKNITNDYRRLFKKIN